jgi:Holliday junction resolvase
MTGGAFSRNKGATFERDVAKALRDYTGIKFERNLEQYRKDAQGDLIADDVEFPFTIECKRAAAPGGRMKQWQRQVLAAAQDAGKLPCVIYRYDRGQMRAMVPLAAIWGRSVVADEPEWADVSIIGLAEIVAELMGVKRWVGRMAAHYTPENAPADPTPDDPDTDGFSA